MLLQSFFLNQGGHQRRRRWFGGGLGGRVCTEGSPESCSSPSGASASGHDEALACGCRLFWSHELPGLETFKISVHIESMINIHAIHLYYYYKERKGILFVCLFAESKLLNHCTTLINSFSLWKVHYSKWTSLLIL